MERSRLFPPSDVTEDLDNVLRLRLAGKMSPTVEERNRHRRLGRDWSADLVAVQQASETMMENERRAREIEARGVALAERALQQLKEAESRIAAADDAVRVAEAHAIEAETRVRDAEIRAREAEARVKDAEIRAREAEDWLMRLHDVIQDRLVARGSSQGHTAAA